MTFSSIIPGRVGAVLLLGLAGAATMPSDAAHACSTEPYMSEICATAASVCPRGYSPADGQILTIASNSALFALLGNTFGGDGRTTFALPNLNHRSVVGYGNNTFFGEEWTKYGNAIGATTATIPIANMPAHNHQVTETVGVSPLQSYIPFNATSASMLPVANISPGATVYPANARAGANLQGVYTNAAPVPATQATMPAAGTFGVSISGDTGWVGFGTPISFQTPVLPVTYCINVFGKFPPRN